MADEVDARREVNKMLANLHGCDQAAVDTLVHFARAVPVASLVKVRESLRRRGIVGVGYAVNALKSEAREGNG